VCGIAGIAFNDTSRPADEPMLRRMTAVMRYRGPDSEGFHVGAGIGLGMCRLSIIDTVTGDQPIANEDGSLVVICNGEIYNYVELREQLLAKGHRFRSHSDVEVIVHLYEDDPDGFLDRLRGMFAFALWDAKRRRLLLVRDRLGIKPLHYAVTREGIVFGSELKTVLASGLIPPTRNERALKEVFALGFVRAPHTMIAGARRLLPGQWLRFEAGQVTTKCYWDVTFPDHNEYDRSLSADRWAEALREKLAETVRLHLRSDVPVGTWLSGGIDSSAVTALMCRELRKPFHSFTLGFESRDIDEVKQNRLLDEYPDYQLIGHRMECGGEHSELLSRAVWHREQPFGLPLFIPRMLISELAAKHVKVVLTGEGADETLGGYRWYRLHKILAPLAVLPQALRTEAARWMWSRWSGAARILKAPAELGLARFGALIGARGKELPEDLFVSGGEEPEELNLPDAFRRWHPFAQVQYLDMKWRLADMIIPLVDLPSMAYSLEARAPFLDHEFVEFCSTIPPWIKMRGLREKDVLRRAMRGVVPPEICRRKKFGMSAPTRDWMPKVIPLLAERRRRDDGCFNPSRVAALISEHQAGRQDQSRLLLGVFTTQLWNDIFLKTN